MIYPKMVIRQIKASDEKIKEHYWEELNDEDITRSTAWMLMEEFDPEECDDAIAYIDFEGTLTFVGTPLQFDSMQDVLEYKQAERDNEYLTGMWLTEVIL